MCKSCVQDNLFLINFAVRRLTLRVYSRQNIVGKLITLGTKCLVKNTHRENILIEYFFHGAQVI